MQSKLCLDGVSVVYVSVQFALWQTFFIGSDSADKR